MYTLPGVAAGFFIVLRHSCLYKAPVYLYFYEKVVYCFAYADTVRTGQHYNTKGIYEETCKLFLHCCLLIPMCLYYFFILLITGATTFSEPHRDTNLGQESRMLFKMVLICLTISLLGDIKTE